MKKMLVQEKEYQTFNSIAKASKEIRKIISLNINIGEYDEIKKNIIQKAIRRESSYVCFANVHMTVESNRNDILKEGVNNAYCVFPDGMPLVWALKLFYGIKQERITGMDVMPDILNAAQKYKLPVFFIGSTQDVLNKALKVCKEKYPIASIAGTLSPPFRNLSEEEEQDIIRIIKKSGASIVFVALGCPKQEQFMYKLSKKIDAVMFGIGGALPVFAGEIGRAPKWMQDIGLEWFYRLIQEPGRLFKRYALTNSLFVIFIIKQFFIKGKK